MLSRVKSRFCIAFLTALMVLIPALATTSAWAAAPRARAKSHVIRPLLPSPEKDAAIVVDGATGKVLYARNPDAIRYPASLTKMMTLYLLFDALEKGTITLDTPLIASTHAVVQEPTKLYVPLGTSISVDTAIKAITVLSANDVAVILAEALGGGSEITFASMMTEKAHELGMEHTNFHNASGLPDLEQLTTARDMALLARHLAYDFPQYYHYFSVPSFAYNGRVYNNHDNLLSEFDGVDGLKTGYTQLSGYNLVTSVVRDNKHVVGVVMGGPTAAVRDREMLELVSAAFEVENENPAILADANVPWQGGNGPGVDLFKADPGEDDVLLAVLEAKGRKTSPVILADARAKGARSGTAATITPLLKPAPAPTSTQLAQAGAQSLPPIRLGAVPPLSTATPPAQIAEGDGVGAAPAPFAPKPAAVAAVKHWAVQIGVFASETLAQAQLAVLAKRSVDVLGQAERIVIPYTTGGRTLYRARFGLFAENEARDICKTISRRGHRCVPAPEMPDRG